MTEMITANAFYAVAIKCAFYFFTSNHEAYTCLRCSGGFACSKSWLRFDLKTALSITPLKSAGVSSLTAGGKRCSVTISDWNVSDSQTLAAFGATASENCATVLGGHACTETVSTLLLDGAGLESTLHDL